MSAARAVLVAVLAGACSSPHAPAGPGSGGSGGSAGAPVAACEELRAKVEQLYRAEAEQREPKRVDDAVADNAAMVLGECGAAPGRVAPCVRAAATVAEVERCLAPLDDEGTEGEALRR